MAMTVENLQAYAKDKAEENDLLEGALQSSPELIALAMQMAVDDFNAEAPLSRFTLVDFPSDTVMLYGTLHHLCNGEAERQLRNQVTYSAQGLNANLDDKFEVYNRLAGYYRTLFETKTAKLKQALNIAQAWGGTHSPYAAINEFNYQD